LGAIVGTEDFPAYLRVFLGEAVGDVEADLVQLFGIAVDREVHFGQSLVDGVAVGQVAHAGALVGAAVLEDLAGEDVAVGGEGGADPVGEDPVALGGEAVGVGREWLAQQGIRGRGGGVAVELIV